MGYGGGYVEALLILPKYTKYGQRQNPTKMLVIVLFKKMNDCEVCVCVFVCVTDLN